MEKNDIVLLSPLDKFQLDVAVFNDRALCTLGCMYFGYLEIDFYKWELFDHINISKQNYARFGDKSFIASCCGELEEV